MSGNSISDLLVSNPLSLAYYEAAYIIIEHYSNTKLKTNYASYSEEQEWVALEYIYTYSTGASLSDSD